MLSTFLVLFFLQSVSSRNLNRVESPIPMEEAPLNGCQNEEECEYGSRQRVGRSSVLTQKRQVPCDTLPSHLQLNCNLFMGKRRDDFSRRTYERPRSFVNPLQFQDPVPRCTKFTCRFNPSGKKKFMVKKGVRDTALKEDNMGDVTSDTNSKTCTDPTDLFCYSSGGAGRKRSIPEIDQNCSDPENSQTSICRWGSQVGKKSFSD